jgi:thiol-disulfide isomerase/thioredoxin
MRLYFSIRVLMSVMSIGLAGPGTLTASGSQARLIHPRQTLPSIDVGGIKTLVEKHRGKVLVLNIWATWCVPCVEEFPDLIKLARDLDQKDVSFVGVSIDEPEDSTSKVLPFIRRQAVPFEILLKSPGHDEQFINALNSNWTGAVPVTFIFDATGKQRRMMAGKQRYDSLRKAVEEIIGKTND